VVVIPTPSIIVEESFVISSMRESVLTTFPAAAAATDSNLLVRFDQQSQITENRVRVSGICGRYIHILYCSFEWPVFWRGFDFLRQVLGLSAHTTT